MDDKKKEKGYAFIQNIDDVLLADQNEHPDYNSPTIKKYEQVKRGEEPGIHTLGHGEDYHRDSNTADTSRIPPGNSYKSGIREAHKSGGIDLFDLFKKIKKEEKKVTSVILIVAAVSVFSLGVFSEPSTTGYAITGPAYSFYHALLALVLLGVAVLIFRTAKEDGIRFFYK